MHLRKQLDSQVVPVRNRSTYIKDFRNICQDLLPIIGFQVHKFMSDDNKVHLFELNSDLIEEVAEFNFNLRSGAFYYANIRHVNEQSTHIYKFESTVFPLLYETCKSLHQMGIL